jgi:hypothetical protein
MKNFGKIPNHISIRDEEGMYKKRKKSRKKSSSSRKNFGSTGTSKLSSQTKPYHVIFHIFMVFSLKDEIKVDLMAPHIKGRLLLLTGMFHVG